MAGEGRRRDRDLRGAEERPLRFWLAFPGTPCACLASLAVERFLARGCVLGDDGSPLGAHASVPAELGLDL